MALPKAPGRTERTRAQLHQALLSLVVERGYNDITVRDIVERANVGRTTFYTHFQDKYELLMSGMDALRTELIACVRSSVGGDGEELAFAQEFFRQGAIYLEPFRSLSGALRADAQERLMLMLVEAARLELKLRSRFKRPSEAADAIAYGVAGTIMGLVEWWIRQAQPVASEALYATFQRLSARGFGDVVSERFGPKCSRHSTSSVV